MQLFDIFFLNFADTKLLNWLRHSLCARNEHMVRYAFKFCQKFNENVCHGIRGILLDELSIIPPVSNRLVRISAFASDIYLQISSSFSRKYRLHFQLKNTTDRQFPQFFYAADRKSSQSLNAADRQLPLVFRSGRSQIPPVFS